MNSRFILIFILIFSSARSFALEFAFLESENAVLNQEQRERSSDWSIFWNTKMPIIMNGTIINKQYQKKIKSLNQFVDAENLEDLYMEHLSFDVSKKHPVGAEIAHYQFIISIVFYENPVLQGTINLKGSMDYDLSKLEYSNLNLQYYSFSHWWGEGSEWANLINQYDVHFVKFFAENFLLQYLNARGTRTD